MIDVLSIFKNLDNDPQLQHVSGLLTRMLSNSATIKMFVATDSYQGIRYALFKLQGKWSDEEVQSLPQWSGMTIEQIRMSILDFHNDYFLILSNQNAEDREIFELFLQNICNDLMQVEHEDQLFLALRTLLNKWKVFFTEHGTQGLSRTKQRGLYGELWFLKSMLEYNLRSELVHFWTGAKRTNHDFGSGSKAVEVKTSTVTLHHRFMVANETQLDDTGLHALYLLFLSLGELNRGGNRLFEIVEDIRNLLRHDAVALDYFQDQLFNYGYLDEQSHLYDTGFVIRGVNAYHVREGFPRVIADQIPHGVGDITYSVQVSMCEPFRVPLDSVIESFSS